MRRKPEIINLALSLPFLARNRLIIVRRTENFTVDELANFVSYLDDPSETTCIIFISGKTDFKKKFPEVNVGEVARRTISDKIEELEKLEELKSK